MKYYLLLLFLLPGYLIQAQSSSNPSDSIIKSEIDCVYDLTSVEIAARYPGGENEMYKYISKNFYYTKRDLDRKKWKDKKPRIFIQFVVNKNGDIKKVKVVRGVNPYLDAEAIRVIKGMPQWEPSYLDGKPVSVRYLLPIVIKI